MAADDLNNPLGDQSLPAGTMDNPLEDPVQKAPDPNDYLTNFDHTTILKNPAFLEDIRKYYEKRDGQVIWDNEDLVNTFMADRTFSNVSSLGLGIDLVRGHTQGSEQNAREGRIQQVYQQLPNFWQEGGRGWAGLAENVAAVATDPLNLIPLGEIAKTAQGVKVAVDAANAGRSALGAAVRQGAVSATREGLITGTIGGAYDAAAQERDIQLGIQPSFEWARVAESAALMAAPGALLAGAGGLLRGGAAASRTIAQIDKWPEARGQMLDVLKGFKDQAEVAAAEGNKDIAALKNAKASAQQKIIDDMDQVFRNRNREGDADAKLGIEPEEASTPEVAPGEDPTVAANRVELQKQIDMYDKELANPHVDPTSAESFRNMRSNLVRARDYEANMAGYNNAIARIDQDLAKNPKAEQQLKLNQLRNSIGTDQSQLTALRDALLRGAPKSPAEMEQAVEAHGLPGALPNRGYAEPSTGAEGSAGAGATPGATPGTPAPELTPAPNVPTTGPEAPPPAAPPTGSAAQPEPGPASAPTAAGGGGGGGGGGTAAPAAAPAPPPGAAVAETAAAAAPPAAPPAAAPAAAPAAKAPKGKATKEPTREIFTPKADGQEMPADAVLPPGWRREVDQATGVIRARLASHPAAEAPVEAVSKEAGRIDPVLTDLVEEVHNSGQYKNGGKSTPGHLSMTEVLQDAGYDADATDAIRDQILAKVTGKGLPKEEITKIKREMLTEAIVAKQIEHTEHVLETAGITPSIDILKAEINSQVTSPQIASVAASILKGEARLNFGEANVEVDNFAQEFFGNLEQQASATKKGGDRLAGDESNGLSPEQKSVFKGIAQKEAEKVMATMKLSMDSRGVFHSQVMQFTDMFLNSTSVPARHGGRLAILRTFLEELKDRMERREAGRTSGPTARALGERGTLPGGEGKFGNPDSIYKKNPLRPDKRAGIPSILKQANNAGFIGRNLSKADIGTVGEAIARAEQEKWQNVRAITLKEGYETADGKTLKPGDVVYFNPITKKAYADHRLAGRSRPDGGPQATGGETVIPAVPSARETAEAEAAGVDPVKYATRMRDLEPKKAVTKEELTSATGTAIPAGSEYFKAKDGSIYRDLKEFRKAQADAVKKEPPPEEGMAPATAAPAPKPLAPAGAAAVPEKVRLMAQAINVDPVFLYQQLIEGGLVPEGPIPAPEIPVTAGAVGGGPPADWRPPSGRKLSIRNRETGSVRTLGANQRTIEDMLAGQPPDGWEIGSNKEGMTSGRQGSAREDFILAGQEPVPTTKPEDVVPVPKTVDPGEMLSVEQARTTPLATTLMVTDTNGNIIPVKTALEAAEVLRDLHSQDWPATQVEMRGMIDNIEALTKATPRVKQPSVVRAAARQELKELFAKIAPDELPLALDAIRRIPGVDLPSFRESAALAENTRLRGVATGFAGRNTTDARGQVLPGGTIGLTDPRNLPGELGPWNPDEYPVITILHHELGHWGYDNLLSNEDRLSYLRWVHDNFYKGGELSQDLVNQIAPTQGGKLNPQEMFASMFQRYVASNGKMMPMPVSLMQRFSKYIANFIDRWFNRGTKVDRKLEPLFAKIMPDPSADSWLKTLGSEGKTPDGQAIVTGLKALDTARYNIELGLTSSDPAQIEEGIRVAMRGIDANKEIIGKDLSERLSTRLGNIVREKENALRSLSPDLAAISADFADRKLNANEIWNAKPEGERKILRQNFENESLATIGEPVTIGDEDWIVSEVSGDPNNPIIELAREVELGTDTTDAYTRNDLALKGAGHIVSKDDHDVTKLVLSDRTDPVLANVMAANEAHDVLRDAFAEHEAAFNRVEGGGSAIRVDNPTELSANPIGSLAAAAVYNQDRLNAAIKLFEKAKTTTDIMGVEDFLEAIDEIGHVTGRSGIHKGKVVDWFGRPHFKLLRDMSTTIRARGREIVDDGYRVFSDHDPEREAQYMAAQREARKSGVKPVAGEAEYQRRATVTMATMTDMQRALYDAQIQRALDFIPDAMKELDRVRRRAEGITKKNIESGAYVVGQKITTAAQKKARMKNVAKIAATKRARPQDEIRGLGAAPDMPAPASLTEDQLAEQIIKYSARSKAGLHYGAELNRRDKTNPYLAHIKSEDIPNDTIQAGSEQLGAMLKAAIESGDKKTADQIRWEAFRRSKNQIKKRGGDLLSTADPVVVSSIDREMRQTMGVPDNVGVPEGAPAMIKDVLSRFTHRKPEVQTSLRSAMYRLFNLGGITDNAARDGFTVERLFRMAGRKVPDELSPSATVFDIREPAFSEVRSAMRRLVGNFAEGKGDPGENISNMLEMVLRSGLLEDTEYGAIHDAYDLTSDSIRRAVQDSRLVPTARKPDAWFADHVSEYLMGERGTAEMFKPDKNMAAPGFTDVLPEIKRIAERVKDATAYVVNGLMHENMRKEFPTLTDYGDVFEGPRATLLDGPPPPAGMEEQGMLNQNALDPDGPRIISIVLNTMAGGDRLEMDRMPAARGLLTDAAEKGGAGPRTNKVIAAATDKLRDVKGLQETLRYNFGHIYKRGSDLMREYDMNWWANKLNPQNGTGLYHKVTVRAADYLMPLYRMGHAMPDAKNFVGNWMDRNKFWKSEFQPPSHANVMETLRGMKSYSSLSKPEKELFNLYDKQRKVVLKQLRDAGVQVGNVGEHFVPQVADTEKMLRDMPEIVDAYADYFVEESVEAGGVIKTKAEALEQSADMVADMTNNDGVYMAPKAERRASRADSIDYQRVIRLHEVRIDKKTGRPMRHADGSPVMVFEKSYKRIQPFLHNHLEGVHTKYYNQAARRLVTTEELGTNSHAFFDYQHVLKGGDNWEAAATQVLATKKVIRQDYLGQVDDGGFEEATRTLELYHPMSDRGAQLAIKEGVKVMGDARTEEDIQNGIAAVLSNMPDKGQTAFRRVDAVMHAIADLKNRRSTKALGRDEFERADRTYRVAMQKPIGSQSNIARKTARGLLNFNSITMLGWTALTATTDLMYPLIRSGRLGAFFRALGSYATDPAYRIAMRNAGASIEQLAHDRIGILHSGQGSKLTRAFFNLNMLTHWDTFIREIGSSVGLEAFRAEQSRALRAGKGTRAWRLAETRLKRYGLDHYLTNGKSLGDPSLMNIETGDRDLREGVIKFVNECVFTHTPDDIPLWAQTPLGKVAFQLKSFQLMMGRMVWGQGGVMGEASKFFTSAGKEGSVMPLIYMLTIGTGFAAGTNALKDLAQGRGGPTSDTHALRDRSFTKIAKQFGWDATVHGPADQFLGSYVEAFMMLGGFGYLTDLLYQAGQSADNGAWGYQRFLGSVLGPTAELAHNVYEGGTVAKDVLTGASTPATGRSNARAFVGDAARRIPIFGGMRSIAGAITDTIAGPKNTPGGATVGGYGGIGAGG